MPFQILHSSQFNTAYRRTIKGDKHIYIWNILRKREINDSNTGFPSIRVMKAGQWRHLPPDSELIAPICKIQAPRNGERIAAQQWTKLWVN
jgi:hypothetical protein